MKKMKEMLQKLQENNPILAGAAAVFLKTLAITGTAVIVVLLALWGFGVYDTLETALDLKANSPVLQVPMWGTLVLCILCMVVGVLMYFHKYKRTAVQGEFYNAVAPALGLKTKKER